MLNVYISFGRLMGIRKRVQTTVNCLALPRTHTLTDAYGTFVWIWTAATRQQSQQRQQQRRRQYYWKNGTVNFGLIQQHQTAITIKKRSGTKCSKHWALKPLNVLLFHSFYFILTQDGRYSCICVCVHFFHLPIHLSLRNVCFGWSWWWNDWFSGLFVFRCYMRFMIIEYFPNQWNHFVRIVFAHFDTCLGTGSRSIFCW